MERDSVALARQFVERKLAPWPQVEAALIVGSIAHGESRADSDVDMILVFETVDMRIVPGEFVWVPADDTFHSIFAPEPAEASGVQIDAQRVSLHDLAHGDLAPGLKHDLAHSLTLFDRSGKVGRILEDRLAYPDDLRRASALRHRGWAALHAGKAGASHRQRWVSVLGWAGAIDLIAGAFDEVVSLVHALNGEFEPFRYRRLLSAAKLRWLPPDFALLRDAVLTPPTADPEAHFLHAYSALERVLEQIDAQFSALGWATDIGDVWVQDHPDLGYAYNMAEWRSAHEALLRERDETRQ